MEWKNSGWNFLGGSFIECQWDESVTPQMVAADFIDRSDDEDRSQVLTDLKEILADIDMTWTRVRDEANWYFKDSGEAASWLSTVIEAMECRLLEKGSAETGG